MGGSSVLRDSVVTRLCPLLALLCVACTPTPTKGDGGAAMAGRAGTAADSGVCTYNPLLSPTDCPDDAPSACPDPAPSYKTSVAPMIVSHCRPCHGVGGQAADKPFDAYAKIYQVRRTALDRVKRCIMPPACASQPTAGQRHDFLQWLVCGAPDN